MIILIVVQLIVAILMLITELFVLNKLSVIEKKLNLAITDVNDNIKIFFAEIKPLLTALKTTTPFINMLNTVGNFLRGKKNE